MLRKKKVVRLTLFFVWYAKKINNRSVVFWNRQGVCEEKKKRPSYKSASLSPIPPPPTPLFRPRYSLSKPNRTAEISFLLPSATRYSDPWCGTGAGGLVPLLMWLVGWLYCTKCRVVDFFGGSLRGKTHPPPPLSVTPNNKRMKRKTKRIQLL